MTDVSELIARASRELGFDASDDEVTAKVFGYIEALPETERAELMQQLVKGTSSARLAHLREIPEADHEPRNGAPE
jgi:DNA-directed RNA polymerase specialized sigma24 family protein